MFDLGLDEDWNAVRAFGLRIWFNKRYKYISWYQCIEDSEKMLDACLLSLIDGDQSDRYFALAQAVSGAAVSQAGQFVFPGYYIFELEREENTRVRPAPVSDVGSWIEDQSVLEACAFALCFYLELHTRSVQKKDVEAYRRFISDLVDALEATGSGASAFYKDWLLGKGALVAGGFAKQRLGQLMGG